MTVGYDERPARHWSCGRRGHDGTRRVVDMNQIHERTRGTGYPPARGDIG